jgi:hypothetical protein
MTLLIASAIELRCHQLTKGTLVSIEELIATVNNYSMVVLEIVVRSAFEYSTEIDILAGEFTV